VSDNDAQVDLDSSIVDWVIEHPESIPIFEKFGIDYSCAGKSLEYACQQSGIDPRFIVNELRRVIA
jgi:regulator of cell morphogenesis and NO signaling